MKTKRSWWIVHFAIILLCAPIFLIVSLMALGWMVSTPSGDPLMQKTFQNILTSISFCSATLMWYPIAVLYIAVRYKNKLLYRPTVVATIVAACVLLISFGVYTVNVNSYRAHNDAITDRIITPKDDVNDYICPENDGNRAFFNFHPQYNTLGYTTVKASGSFHAGTMNFSSSSQTILINENVRLGSVYQWSTEVDKRLYLEKCINKNGESLLDKYKYQEVLSKNPKK